MKLARIVIAAHSPPEMLRILLSHLRAEYVLIEQLNQDGLENYFAKQRARGHQNDNPSVAQFMENVQALIVQKFMESGFRKQ